MSGDDRPQLRMLCLTRLWLFSRRLHNLGNVPLWTPVSHRTLGWSLIAGLPWVLLVATFGIGLAGMGLSVYVLPPALAVWWVVNMVDGGARPAELVRSWLAYTYRCRWQSAVHRLAGRVRTVR